jgi:cell division protein FtsI/penicillin-binding protein 2
MNRQRVLACLVLPLGFLLGKGAANALDLAGTPDAAASTTTVGNTPEPDEGTGTPEDTDDELEVPSGADPMLALPGTLDEWDDDDTVPLLPPQPLRRTFEVGVDLKKALDGLQLKGEQVLAPRDGRLQPTTLRAHLQQAAQHLLEDYDVPAGAVVMLDPMNGHLLAMAAHTADQSFGRELAVLPLAPAASVFKIVTGAALLEKGVTAEHETCYSGGKRRVRSRDLNHVPRHGRCVSLALAMARSANIPFARMTQERLSQADLERWSSAFLFNRALPLGAPASPALIPGESGLAFAATGAGFGDVRLSAFHGALLTSAVANGGILYEPALWLGLSKDRFRRVMDAEKADVLGRMLERTVTEGTARRAFRERKKYVLGSIRAAGKTGSLAEQGPFRDYSWFVGYAPADRPSVVVAAFVMNNAQWRIRASYVGREMLRTALVKGHKPYRPTEDVARR